MSVCRALKSLAFTPLACSPVRVWFIILEQAVIFIKGLQRSCTNVVKDDLLVLITKRVSS